ncbi:MAG: carboxypeptidase-like regulatory domain-containing protein, partial [Sandaracinaceae bacterium]|nr:carboxypeptidase-like regulatory domain-containing protein [Sandaracinaceae bacterium]
LEAEALGSLSPSEHSSSPHRLHLRVEPFASMGDGTKPQGIAAIESDDGKVLDSRPIGNGLVVFEGVPEGNWVIRIRAKGYSPWVRAIRIPSQEIVATLLQAGTIFGEVRGLEGEAHQAKVALWGSGIWPPRLTQSDVAGRFGFDAIPAGVYDLRAENEWGVAMRRGLVLKAGDVAFVRLELKKGAWLRGWVRTVQGAALSGAEVRASGEGVETISAFTDSGGHFELGPLLSSTGVRVEVLAKGMAPFSGHCSTERPCLIWLEPGSHLEGEVRDAKGHLLRGANLRLIPLSLESQPPEPFLNPWNLGVTERVPPIPHGSPEPHEALRSPSPIIEASSEGFGRFVFENLAPGSYVLEAHAPGHGPYESPPISLKSGDRKTITVSLPEQARLKGWIRDHEGRPVRAKIEIRDRKGRLLLGKENRSDGFFEFVELGGLIDVLVWPDDPQKHSAFERWITLAPGEEQTIALTLPRLCPSTKLLVVDESHRQPIEGALVELECPEMPSFSKSARTDSKGNVLFDGLPALPLWVRVSHPVFAPSGRFIGPCAQNQSIELSPALSAEVRIESERSGEPIAGARLLWTCKAPPPCSIESRSDSSGVARVRGLRPAIYVLEAEAKGHAPSRFEINITAQRNGPLVLSPI